MLCLFFFTFISFVFFFKQKTAYEMRISDWSSDVCSSDLTLDEILCPISLAKAKILEPVDRVKTEAVIELRDVDVGRLQLGAAPHHLGDLRLRLRVERVELGPAVAIAHRRADRLDQDRRVLERARAVPARPADRHRTVPRHIPVIGPPPPPD